MAAGFWDLVSFALGWKSAGPADEAAVTEAGQVWTAGQADGQTFTAGRVAGETFTAGQRAGDIHA